MGRWVDQRASGDERIELPVRRVATAALGLLLCIGGPAWAGGGGAASMADNLQFSNIVCNAATGINQSYCNSLIPKLPTVNQLVLQAAAILGETPASIRTGNFSTPPGTVFDAGKQATFFYQSGQPLNGMPMPYTSLPAQLGFIAGQGQPIPTSSGANSLLSATTTPTTTAPTTLDLTFDFHPRTNATFSAGQEIGQITLPLAIADINQNLVRDVNATLNIVGTGVGSGFTTNVVGNFLGTGNQTFTDPTNQLDITTSLSFTANGLEVGLTVPLLITSDLIAFPPTGPGFAPTNMGFEFDKTDGLFDGIDPIASFLDASFEDNAGNLLAAVNADLAIAFDASVLLSAPVPTPAPEPTTLLVLGSGLVGLAMIRRRGRKTT